MVIGRNLFLYPLIRGFRLYYECKGHAPLTCGRITKCASRRVRADRDLGEIANEVTKVLGV